MTAHIATDWDLIQHVADDLTAVPVVAFIAALVTGAVLLQLVLAVLSVLGSWLARLAGERREPDDLAGALLQLVEAGAVDYDDVTEGESDRWRLQRWQRRADGGIEPVYVPLTARMERAAVDAREGDLIDHRSGSTEMVLTDAGRAELHAQRYPRPTLGMRARWWAHERGLVRHATPRRDPDTGELLRVPHGTTDPAICPALEHTGGPR